MGAGHPDGGRALKRHQSRSVQIIEVPYHLGRRDAGVGPGPPRWLDASGGDVVKETGAVTGYLGGMTLAAAVGRPASFSPARRILMSTATKYA